MTYKTKEERHAYYMSRRDYYINYAKTNNNNKWKDCSMCGVRYNSKSHFNTRKHLIAEQSLLSLDLKKYLVNN